MINFKNKKILVTGATGGIGREIVKKFISLEGNVVATGTNIEKLDLLKKDFPNVNVIKFDISDHSKIGIHPSFASNTSFNKLEKEVGRLSKIINREIWRSRQHFLKVNLPETYRNLIELDITDDFTMKTLPVTFKLIGTAIDLEESLNDE